MNEHDKHAVRHVPYKSERREKQRRKKTVRLKGYARTWVDHVRKGTVKHGEERKHT